MATWGERLKGWLSWVIDEANRLNRLLSLQARFQQDMTVFVAREQLDAWWNSLTDEQRNDPTIKTLYENRRQNLPYSNTTTLDTVKSLSTDVSDFLLKTYINIEGVSPENAIAAAQVILVADTAKDIAVGLAGLAVETASAGQIDTFTDFFKFTRAKTGYGGPATMLMKAPIELGVISPLSKALHAKFRDAYISPDHALHLFTKGLLDEEIVRKAYAYTGAPDWLIDVDLKDRFMEPRMRDFMMATGDFLFDETWLKTQMKRMMVDPLDQPTYITFVQEKYLRPYRDRVASQIRNLYKEGYIDKATFDSRLTQLKIPPAVIRFLASEADYLYRLDLNADLIATWTTAYRNDIISEDVLRGNLASIIVDPARVEAAVNKAAAGRKPKAIAKPKPVTQGIKIISKPANAWILIDGVDTGKLTPETLETTAAVHTLEIGADGFESAGYEVEVEAGKFVEIYAVLVSALPTGSAGPG